MYDARARARVCFFCGQVFQFRFILLFASYIFPPLARPFRLALERMYQNGLRQYSEGLKAEFKKKVEAVKRESEAGMYQVMRDPALDPEVRGKGGIPF